MRFWLLGLAVVLAAQLAAAAAASLVVAWAHRTSRSRLARLAAAARAEWLLALALFPAAAGLATAVAVALAWLVHEPRSTGESPGPVLLALALLGLMVLASRAAAVVGDAVRTHGLVKSFRYAGREMAGLPLPASRAVHEFPVAALAGVWRPRLLLAERVLRALSPAELDAVVAHELAHLDAQDNLKRLLLAASPDPLALTAPGRRLRSEFLAAAEAAADARACASVPPTVLARAIVKVAALVPKSGRLDLAMASFHQDGSLASRVRALVEGPPGLRAVAPRAPRPRRQAMALGVVLAALLAAGIAGSVPALAALHGLIERLVRLLA